MILSESTIEQEITTKAPEEALLKVAEILAQHPERTALIIRRLDRAIFNAILKRDRQKLTHTATDNNEQAKPLFYENWNQCQSALHEIEFCATHDKINPSYEPDGFSDVAFFEALIQIIDAYLSGDFRRTEKDLRAVSFALRAYRDLLLGADKSMLKALGRYEQPTINADCWKLPRRR